MAARLTPNEKLLRQVNERQWQAQVEAVARFGGWLYYHAPDNMPRVGRSGATYVQATRRGFPDLVLVKAGRLLVVELKTETGACTDEQLTWLDELFAAGVEVNVWRPRDRAEVEAVLLRGAAMPRWMKPAAPSEVAVTSEHAPADGAVAVTNQGGPS
jgi:hypothetical protein